MASSPPNSLSLLSTYDDLDDLEDIESSFAKRAAANIADFADDEMNEEAPAVNINPLANQANDEADAQHDEIPAADDHVVHSFDYPVNISVQNAHTLKECRRQVKQQLKKAESDILANWKAARVNRQLPGAPQAQAQEQEQEQEQQQPVEDRTASSIRLTKRGREVNNPYWLKNFETSKKKK